jgi:hypothetical protein
MQKMDLGLTRLNSIAIGIDRDLLKLSLADDRIESTFGFVYCH